MADGRGLSGLPDEALGAFWPQSMLENIADTASSHHERLRDTVANVRQARDTLDQSMALNAETFEKLPVYTAKVQLIANNLKTVARNVERLKMSVHSMSRSTREVCAATGTPAPELGLPPG